MRMRALITAALVAVAAAVFTAAPVAAEPDHSRTLRQICEANDGMFVPRPGWWRARCQGSRASDGNNDGVQAAFMICTMQMGGVFYATTVEPEGTTNWVCL